MCAEEGFPSLRGGRAVARVYGWRLLGTHAPLPGIRGMLLRMAHPLSLVHTIAGNMSESEAIIRSSFGRQGCALAVHGFEAWTSVLLQAGIRLLLVMYLLATLLYVESYFESHESRLRNENFPPVVLSLAYQGQRRPPSFYSQSPGVFLTMASLSKFGNTV